MRALILICIVLNTALLSCNLKNDNTTANNTNEELNQIECPSTVEVFIDTLYQNEIFRGTFSPDGKTFYFFQKVTKNQEDYRIFYSTLKEGNWSNPKWLDLGGEHSDLYPAISKDGTRLVFSSYRPVPSKYENNESKNAHLWYSDFENGQWGEPVFMADANEIGYYHSWVEFGWDDNIYFRKISPDWRNSETLFTQWDGSKYIEPQTFGDIEILKKKNPDIIIAGGSPGPDTSTIFLDVATIDSLSGKRGSDIWISRKSNQEWQDPIPIGGGVNKEGYDVFPFMSPSKDCLYFVRDFETFYHIAYDQVI